MNKPLKKILVASASLLMLASVGAGASSMNKSVHAKAYTEQHTGTLTHSVRFGRHFYRKGSPVYGAQSLGNPTKMYVYLGHDTVDQRLIPDSYYTNAMHLHRHHHYYRPVKRHYRRHAETKRRRKAVRKVVARRQVRKAYKRIRRTRAVRKQSNNLQNPIERNCYELNQQTLKNINRDRRRYHLRSLKVDGQLNQIGNQRSHQLQRYFSHNTPRHADELQYLLNRKHIIHNHYGENIVGSPLGTISILSVGRYDNPSDTSHHRFTYHANNGYQLANNIEDTSMNHDKGDQNGHRDNILDKKFKRIGVGSSYDSHDKNYYSSIEFID